MDDEPNDEWRVERIFTNATKPWVSRGDVDLAYAAPSLECSATFA